MNYEYMNIDGSCLNKGKLHLNIKETEALGKNLYRFVRSFPVDWIITDCEGAFIRGEVRSCRYFRNEKLAFKKP